MDEKEEEKEEEEEEEVEATLPVCFRAVFLLGGVFSKTELASGWWLFTGDPLCTSAVEKKIILKLIQL